MTRKEKPAALGRGQAGVTKVSAAKYIKTIRPGTKEFMILNVLAADRSLNRFEAARLHDTCLNSTISTLQSKGLCIHREWEKVPCVNGTKVVTVCRYSLPADELPKARRLLGLDTDVEVAA
jgi:hypothetical protein